LSAVEGRTPASSSFSLSSSSSNSRFRGSLNPWNLVLLWCLALGYW
jgi:hypothetical protein